MRNAFLCVALLVTLLSPAWAQRSKFEVFGGYSYRRLDSTGFIANLNMNGWEASATVGLYRWLSAEAGINGHYASPTVAGVPVKVREHSFLAGPRLSVQVRRLTPFAHALFGVTHLSTEVLANKDGENAFTMAYGGGLDVKVAPHVAVRLGQADYLNTRFTRTGRNDFRFSTGLVLRF